MLLRYSHCFYINIVIFFYCHFILMSCPNASAPIDIIKNIADECDLKCDYSYNYPNTSVTAQNKGSFIRLAFDPQNVAPVRFNKVKYNCLDARIYHPSLHTFGGKHTPAEIVINHRSETTAQNLLVCVPVIEDSNKAGTLDALITQIASNAPRENSETIISMPGFSLNKIVPGKPYYSYTGTLPYAPCNGKIDYVVYPDTYAVTLSKVALAKLTTVGVSIISAQNYAIHNNSNGYYFNNKGPSPLEGVDDEIYIECNPTGADGKVLVPEGNQPGSGTNANIDIGDKIKNILSSSWFAVLFGAILLYLIIVGFDAIANKLFNPGTQSGGVSNTTFHLSGAGKF